MPGTSLTVWVHPDDWAELGAPASRQHRYTDAVRRSKGRFRIQLRTDQPRGAVAYGVGGHTSGHYLLFPRTRLRRQARREVDATFSVTRDDRPLEVRCGLPEWEHRLSEALDLEYPCAVEKGTTTCGRK